MPKKQSLNEVYFEYQKEYEAKYGKKTVIFMEVGSFFELYGVDNEEEKIGDLYNVCSILNIVVTRRNKTNINNNRSNCLMAGFPTPSLKRFIDLLIEHEYTIVLVEQMNPPKNTIREITKIISPTTNITNSENDISKNLLSIYFEDTTCYITNKKILMIGLSSIDTLIGKSIINEFIVKEDNINETFEDLFRIIETLDPMEIIINTKLNYYNDEFIQKRLPIDNKKIYYNSGINLDKSIYEISYQNNFLNKIYTNTGLLSAIEYLDLEMKNYSRTSFVILLQFAYEHDSTILNRIQKPDVDNKCDRLILSNNTIYQLNILSENKSGKSVNNINSLFDILNKTQTSMGRRLLKYNLVNPTTKIDIINKNYNNIESILNLTDKNCYENINKKMRTIIDFERYLHKINMCKLNPFEFSSFYKSLLSSIELFTYIKNVNIFINYDIEIYINILNNIIKKIDDTLIMERVQKYNLLSIDENIFNSGINDTIDKLEKSIQSIKDKYEKEGLELSNMIEEGSNFLKLEKTEKLGYYFSLAKGRAKKLENELKKQNITKYNFKSTTSNVKISGEDMDKMSNKLVANFEKLKKECKDEFINFTKNLIDEFGDEMADIIRTISYIDYINNGANIAFNYGYCKPNISKLNNNIIDNDDNDDSYFEAKGIRHPIIERLNNKTKYVLNDINMGNDKDGIILFSINGAGKSSLMKAVGLNIIMAQMGYYVPCNQFNYYPFKTIYTRITGNDNIFKGYSSFYVEMSELRTIIKNADKNSLVLGDEICKGTEYISALSIVSAAIEKLAQNSAKFIFATHLHKIIDIGFDNKYDNICLKLLEVEFQENNIKYIRKLKDGSGNSLYGLEVANWIIGDKDFIDTASKTRDILLNKPKLILDDNKSKYNNDIYLDCCTICKQTKETLGRGNLHVHHIQYQEDFRNNNTPVINGKRMNDLCNLVVLCDNHHRMVHDNKLIINDYIQTNNGIQLDYKIL